MIWFPIQNQSNPIILIVPALPHVSLLMASPRLGELPLELLSHIFALTTRQCLVDLALCSTKLHAAAEVLLFRNVEVHAMKWNPYLEALHHGLPSFVYALARRPHRTRQVKYLTIDLGLKNTREVRCWEMVRGSETPYVWSNYS